MQNLEQIRAARANALCSPRQGRTSPDFYRNDVAGIPALILTNGLLSAAAFCCEENKEARAGLKAVFNGIATHLKDRRLTEADTGAALINDLSARDSVTLQRATSEVLAFLSYLKRFAQTKEAQCLKPNS